MSLPAGPPAVRIEPWSVADLDLLVRLNAPEMMVHLGGPESAEKVRRRHARYVDGWRTDASHVFRVVVEDPTRPGSGVSAGAVSYWGTTWQGGPAIEAGWSILPEHQGRGVARLATVAAIEHAAGFRARTGDMERRYLHAFPKTANAASNGVCRGAGFTLAGECDLEYPPGTPIRCNDWFVDLDTVPGPRART